MKIGTSWSQLEEMRVMSSGNPQKIAAYTAAKKRYDEMVAGFFSEEDGVKFFEHPAEWYVESLEKRAKETGDERDVARALILRDRLDHYAQESKKHIDWRETEARLRQALNEGAQLSDKDVQEAYRLAKQNPKSENIVLYSRVKRVAQSQQDGTFVKPDASTHSERSITQEDVDAAYEKAKQTGRIDDRVRYSVLKRQLAAQEANKQ